MSLEPIEQKHAFCASSHETSLSSISISQLIQSLQLLLSNFNVSPEKINCDYQSLYTYIPIHLSFTNSTLSKISISNICYIFSFSFAVSLSLSLSACPSQSHLSEYFSECQSSFFFAMRKARTEGAAEECDNLFIVHWTNSSLSRSHIIVCSIRDFDNCARIQFD